MEQLLCELLQGLALSDVTETRSVSLQAKERIDTLMRFKTYSTCNELF